MKDLIDKLSSYNLFNYLFPGILFTVVAEKLTSFSILGENLLISAFLFYFVGLLISRIGSLILEPLLKKVGFIKLTSYDEYLQAVKNDTKIEILSEANNSYRTLTSAFICLLFLIGIDLLVNKYPQISNAIPLLLILGIIIIFIFSYRKQTIYIAKRGSTANTLNSENEKIEDK